MGRQARLIENAGWVLTAIIPVVVVTGQLPVFVVNVLLVTEIAIALPLMGLQLWRALRGR